MKEQNSLPVDLIQSAHAKDYMTITRSKTTVINLNFQNKLPYIRLLTSLSLQLFPPYIIKKHMHHENEGT